SVAITGPRSRSTAVLRRRVSRRTGLEVPFDGGQTLAHHWFEVYRKGVGKQVGLPCEKTAVLAVRGDGRGAVVMLERCADSRPHQAPSRVVTADEALAHSHAIVKGHD